MFTNRSDTKAGLSTYLDVFDNRWDRVAKIRISGHSVTSDRRILSEYHVFPGQTAKEVVDDILGKEREPEVRLSRDQKEKDETLIRVNKRLEEVSRPVSGQSLNRDSNTSRSENPAESSRLGAESDTNVENHSQKTNKLLEDLANFIGIISSDGYTVTLQSVALQSRIHF
ncbi:MAG: hypothetical protein J6T07_04135 [Bacteroidales bacterium]|nr:hypothetical protein [Bacteroidales bacterium]